MTITDNHHLNMIEAFLAVQNSSIGDLVTDSLTDSLTHRQKDVHIELVPT